MTYKEFKETYKWMLSTYPETSYMYGLDDFNVECEIIHYKKQGSCWVETRREIEVSSNIYYCNVIDAVPFFRRIGGRERVKCSYTRYGYIPYFVSSISPSGEEKVTREFKF